MGHSSSKETHSAARKFATHHGVSLQVQYGDSCVPTVRALDPFVATQSIKPAVQDAQSPPRFGGDTGVATLAVSPTWRESDRQYSLATGSGDGGVRLYCSTTERNYLTLWHGRANCNVRSVSFSPDGTHIASGASDNSVRVWRLPADLSRTYPCTPGESRRVYCVIKLTGHSGGVWSVRYSPVGGFLASGAADGLVLLWRMQEGLSGAPTQRLMENMRARREGAAPQHDDDQSAAGSVGVGCDAEDVIPLSGSVGYIKAVCFSPCGRFVASGGGDMIVRVFSPREGACRMALHGHEGPVTTVAYSSDGTLLASGSADDTVLLWAADCANSMSTPGTGSTVQCAPLRKLHGASAGAGSVPRGPGGIMAMAFSSAGGGDTIAVVSADWQTKLWAVVPRPDDADPQPFVLEGAHTDYTFAVSFSPHGSSLITGSRDSTAVVWRRNPRCVGPSGALAAWQLDSSVRGFVPDARTEDPSPKKGKSPNKGTGRCGPHNSSVTAAAFSPNGTRLATISADAACVWSCAGISTPPQWLGSQARFAEAQVQAQLKDGPALLHREALSGNAIPSAVEWLPGLAEASFVPPQPLVTFDDGSKAAVSFRDDDAIGTW